MRCETWLLGDDGLVPNNPRLPLVVVRGALAVAAEPAPAEAFMALFASHHWRGAWVDGIYPFHHYHASVHEVLGLARGSARVQFGGARGPILDVAAGDVVVIPAGVGHCRVDAAPDLAVVGAYPDGMNADLQRATAAARRASLDIIGRVPLPDECPVGGRTGPLFDHWRA